MKRFAKKVAKLPPLVWFAPLGLVALVVLLRPVRWVVLGLLAAVGVLLLLFLLVPLTIGVRWQGGQLTAWVRVLFVKIPVWPLNVKPAGEKKAKTKKPRQQKAAAEDEDDEEKPRKDFWQRVAFIKRLVAAGKAALYRFLRHLRVKNVRLALPVHAGEAADTAVRCGQLQAAVGTVRALLAGRLRVQVRQLEIWPDFTGQMKELTFFTCKLVFMPGIILPMGFAFLRRWLQKRPYSKQAYRRALAQKRARAAQNAAG